MLHEIGSIKKHPPNSEQANGSETKTQVSIFGKKSDTVEKRKMHENHLRV